MVLFGGPDFEASRLAYEVLKKRVVQNGFAQKGFKQVIRHLPPKGSIAFCCINCHSICAMISGSRPVFNRDCPRSPELVFRIAHGIKKKMKQQQTEKLGKRIGQLPPKWQ